MPLGTWAFCITVAALPYRVTNDFARLDDDSAICAPSVDEEVSLRADVEAMCSAVAAVYADLWNSCVEPAHHAITVSAALAPAVPDRIPLISLRIVAETLPHVTLDILAGMNIAGAAQAFFQDMVADAMAGLENAAPRPSDKRVFFVMVPLMLSPIEHSAGAPPQSCPP